jgi:4-carboxymuconolactone decarboxylase
MDYHEARRARGDRLMAELSVAESEPAGRSARQTLLRDTKRDFVFGEVWSRPGLEPRYRWLTTIICIANTVHAPQIRTYVRGALKSGALNLAEMREVVLHFAVYSGWTKAEVLDDVVSEVADELGLAEPPPSPPLSLEPTERRERGKASWRSVMEFGPPEPAEPYTDAGILNFVFGEMWDRPGLDRVSRRYVTLACVGLHDSKGPIVSHIYSAMLTGQVKLPEMREFVLHFALYAGWPKASQMHSSAETIIKRVESGGSFHDLI